MSVLSVWFLACDNCSAETGFEYRHENASVAIRQAKADGWKPAKPKVFTLAGVNEYTCRWFCPRCEVQP